MRANLVINGLDFADYLAKDGVSQETIERASQSIVTLDGTEHRRSISKRRISVSLLEIPDIELKKISSVLLGQVSVDYTDRSGVERRGIAFYVTGFSASEKTVQGDTTYWSGISFSLEEK